ncbi:DUF4352 domain-containing protein [Kocuria sp. CH-021]|uniref:DUF4352 domain-containing protein n=1 Tax=Kocuria sp. CH-021 TaxID=3406735 RepID=UPI003C710224
MKRNVFALLVLPALMLVGCSNVEADPEPTAPNVEPATAESTPSSTQETSPRGNLMKEIGEPAGIHSLDDPSKNVVTYVVKGIEVDPVCTSPYSMAPENGRFIAIDMEVETAGEPEFTEVMYGPINVSPHSFKMIDANGTTVNSVSSGPSYGCMEESETLLSSIGPGERVTGKVVLDVPSTEGILVYNESIDPSLGWEWKIPQA